MSVTRVTSQMQHFEHSQCKHCNAALPIAALFCGQCGMRVDKDETYSSNMPLSSQGNIATRYRITSLVRRRPTIQLSFAMDTWLQRLIMLRDIDISGLDEAARKLAYTELQQEYDLLRRLNITDVMPLIASHSYEGHLYSVAGWPFSQREEDAAISSIPSPRPYTLHDLLQSGIGLPNEQIATSWVAELAQAVESLHEQQIIIGELDPDTIIMSSHDYSGQPALMVSWLPTTVRHALSQTSNVTHPSSFRAPETLYGQEVGLTDIYSLGALLYLLLTGTAPDPMGSSNSKRYRQRSPRDLNPHISRALEAIVMQALALEPNKRFQRASELAEALLHLERRPHVIRRSRITFARPPKSTPKVVEETDVSSDMDNNGSNSSKEALPIEEPKDETIQIRDSQQQLARSYWSRINTGPLSSQEKQTGEATVDEAQIQEEQTEETVENKYISEQAFEEMPTVKAKKIKKGKKRSNRKNRMVNGRTPEGASSPEVQNDVIQVTAPFSQVVETPAEFSNKVPLLEAIVDAPTEELLVVSSSESTVEMQTPVELIESELSIEQASIDAEQSQVVAKEEATAEQEQVEAEAITQQELVQVEEEATAEQEQVKLEEETITQQELVQVEEEVTAEQEQVKLEEETITQQELVQVGEEIAAEQEQVKLEEEVTAEQEQVQVQVEEEVTAKQEQVQIEEETTAKQELVQVEGEFTAEQEQVKLEEEITAEQEQMQVEGEAITQQELVQVEEEITTEQEQVRVEEEVTAKQEQAQVGKEVVQQEEERQPKVSQEEHAVSTSQALLSPSTSHSGMLPALLPDRSKGRALARIKNLFINPRALLTQQIQPTETDTNEDASFLQRVQRFILGEQKHTTMAAALIETPMRIQPTQSYAMRIQIIGRDQLKDETQTGGLTALSCGDIVHIEVRLALYQSYAYMVQQADVAMPASGYAAEVTVPMHPLSTGPASRRERLHIFFMDKERNPLYEKPFVIELFVSPLVQLGSEGHNVLSIPI